MAEAQPKRLLDPADRAPLAALLGLSLGVSVAASLLGLSGTPDDLSSLGVFFDGHKYIEIAKSFPLPYSAEGDALLGHAPGYPAAIALARVASFGALDWGILAVASSWLAGALATLAFYRLCRACGAEPFWPSVLFAVANPRWVAVASTAHAEPLAVLLAILGFLAWRRGAAGWCVAWLALATLTRFPALVLVGPLVAAVVMGRSETPVRTALLLAVPFAALALFEAYLRWHVPGFASIADAHAFWWQPRWSLPFVGLVRFADAFPAALPLRGLTWISAGVAVASVWVGFRRLDRELWWLPLWTLAVVLVAASPDDPVGARAFTRLAILAWPPVVLVLWLAFGARVRGRAFPALACAALAAGSVWLAARLTQVAIQGQRREQPYLLQTIQRLDADEPFWIDFRAIEREKQRRRRRSR